MFEKKFITNESISPPTTRPTSSKMRQSCSDEHLETRFLTMILFIDKLTSSRFKFSFKDAHTIFRNFIFNSVTNSVNKIREILWN